MATITVSSIEQGISALSRREAEVLYWLLQGKATRDVAAHLDISTATVQKHLKNTYRKLDVHNKIEALQKTKWLLTAMFGNRN